MSKIGKKTIMIPEGVSVDIKEDSIEVIGKSDTLKVPRLSGIKVEIKDNEIAFSPEDKNKQTLSNWGTQRSLTQNAVIGVVEGFKKELIIKGVGYRARVEDKSLVLGLGFSHPIKYSIPEGINITVEKNTVIVSGIDKAAVGEAAAKIRSFRKPEPYKGKGIRYSDEIVRRKPGKKAVGATEI